MNLTIQNILLVLAIVCVGVAYLIAGIIASDRFGRRSKRVDHLLTYNEFCFSICVLFWPVVWFFGWLYFMAADYLVARRRA